MRCIIWLVIWLRFFLCDYLWITKIFTKNVRSPLNVVSYVRFVFSIENGGNFFTNQTHCWLATQENDLITYVGYFFYGEKCFLFRKYYPMMEKAWLIFCLFYKNENEQCDWTHWFLKAIWANVGYHRHRVQTICLLSFYLEMQLRQIRFLNVWGFGIPS